MPKSQIVLVGTNYNCTDYKMLQPHKNWVIKIVLNIRRLFCAGYIM